MWNHKKNLENCNSERSTSLRDVYAYRIEPVEMRYLRRVGGYIKLDRIMNEDIKRRLKIQSV
jgi:hypothetical protein